MKKIISIITATVISLTASTSVFAENLSQESSDPLEIYMNELTAINEELGTNYSIPIEYFDDVELEEVTQMFTQMSISDFRDYVYNAHSNNVSQKMDIDHNDLRVISSNSGSNPDSKALEGHLVPTKIVSDGSSTNENVFSTFSSYTPVTQRYYYSSGNTNNYLYIQTETFVMADRIRYNRYNFSGGYQIGSYPGYKATDCNVSFSSNDIIANVSYTCIKIIESGISEGKPFSVTCTFTAGGGDIYAV